MTAPADTVALVLAAGRSLRFNGDKLLHAHRGKPLAAHIADTLATLPLRHRIAVCPAGNRARAALFAGRGFEVVANDDPAAGMGRSLALGAARAIELEAAALLVCLADMPAVTAGHLRNLIAASTAAEAVATEADGTRSPPAIFARALLPGLAALTGDRGARDLIRGASVVAASPETVRDYDRPEDFA